jgi:transcriptional regulator with XRE-family HTH domain
MSDLTKNLKPAFRDKDYRHGYADEFLNSSIATQLKVLREQRNWSQEELARRAEMLQPRISVMENVNYSSWSINTLRKLAEAFDLTLSVSFEGFGQRLVDIERFNRESLERFSFDEDPIFTERDANDLAVKSKFFYEAQTLTVGNTMESAATKAVNEQNTPPSEGSIFSGKAGNGIKNELTALGKVA